MEAWQSPRLTAQRGWAKAIMEHDAQMGMEAAIGRLLSRLKKRQILLHRMDDGKLAVFHTDAESIVHQSIRIG